MNSAQMFHRLGRLVGLRAGRLGEISFPAIARKLAADRDLADIFGMLLQSICAQNGARGRGVFLITSAQPEEGKTTVASHLTVVGRLARQNVIFVDGDLRRPSIIHGVEAGAPGFRELLAGEVEVKDVIRSAEVDGFEDGDTTVSFIPSGPIYRGPGAVNYSRAAEVFGSLKQDFDVVIVDSPPLLAVNDAEFLAPAVDGIVHIISAGDVLQEDAMIVKERLDRSGTPIIGVVLNRFNDRRHGYSVYPYQDYYSKFIPR